MYPKFVRARAKGNLMEIEEFKTSNAKNKIIIKQFYFFCLKQLVAVITVM